MNLTPERARIVGGIVSLLIAEGYKSEDAGLLALHAEREIHELVLEMADEEKNQADAGWRDDDGLTDAEADAMTLASAGMGTDEDYGFFDYDQSYDFD